MKITKPKDIITDSGPGFTLLELILAVAIFASAALATGYLIIESMGATDANSKKIQATFLAREGLEAARMIRDNGGYDALEGGDNALVFDENSETWSFDDPSPEIIDEIYERTITIANYDHDGTEGKLITSTVRVPTLTRDIVVSLETVLTPWPEL